MARKCGVAVSPRTKSELSSYEMGSMALCPTVRLLFPLWMAIRHRTSSLLLPSFPVIGSSPSLFFLVLGYFLVWPCCPCVVCIAVAVLAVLTLRGTPWFPYRRYAGNSIFKQHNKVSPPWDTGTPRHWNPESKHPDIGTSGHWNPKCTGRRKGTDPRTGKGYRPKERHFFQVSPRASWAVSSLPGSWPSRSWRLRRPGWCTLVAGTVFGLFFPSL